MNVVDPRGAGNVLSAEIVSVKKSHVDSVDCYSENIEHCPPCTQSYNTFVHHPPMPHPF